MGKSINWGGTLILFLTMFPTFAVASINSDVPVNLNPGKELGLSYSAPLSDTDLINIVKSEILLTSDISYQAANVFSIEDSYYETGEYEFIVYLLRKNTYKFDTALVAVDENGELVDIEMNYGEVALEQTDSYSYSYSTCPDDSVEVVFATPCASSGSCGLIPTAVDAVEDACDSAEAAGYSCRVLLGNQATVAAYQSWMSCRNLIALGNVGHGSISGIYLHDGVLASTWFDDEDQSSLLTNEVLYFNSCQVHNSPLEPSIIGNANARTFIGGNINLRIGTSEEVFKCFFEEQFDSMSYDMTSTLTNCEAALYPTQGAHGISGRTQFTPLMFQIYFIIPLL